MSGWINRGALSDILPHHTLTLLICLQAALTSLSLSRLCAERAPSSCN